MRILLTNFRYQPLPFPVNGTHAHITTTLTCLRGFQIGRSDGKLMAICRVISDPFYCIPFCIPRSQK